MKKYTFILLFIISNYIYSYNAVVFNGSGISNQEKLIALTLAGIVNRDSARLYLVNVYEGWSFTQMDETWRDIYTQRGNVTFETVTTLSALINRFRSFITGAITYDPYRFFSNFSGQNFMWQGEVAATIGGLTNRLPVSSAMAASLNLSIADSVLIADSFDGDSSIYVTGRLELSNHIWNNTALNEEQRYLTLLNWGVQKLLPRCNPESFYLREITDFPIQKKMFQVNLAGTGDLDFNSMPTARADVLEVLLNYMQLKNEGRVFHIYGWIRPEPMVQWFACYGASFHETLLSNLSFHSTFPVAYNNYTPPSVIDTNNVQLENKYYVVIIGSEGDAGNWVIGLQSGAWLSNARGTIPVNWGVNLQMFKEFPFIAKYYYETATPNDGFASVTSPLGYFYPDLLPQEKLQGAVDSTKALMQRFGVDKLYGYKHYCGSGSMVFRGKTINNSYNFQKYTSFLNATNTKLTMLYDPLLYSQTPVVNNGALLFNHTGDNSFYGDVSNLNTFANNVIVRLKNKPKPYFYIGGYQRFRQDDFENRTAPASHDISISRLAAFMQTVKNDPTIGADVEFVTVEKFAALMRKKVFTGIKEIDEKPIEYSLSSNYPNPFNPSTIIEYTLPFASKVIITVYDVLGNEVEVLVNEEKAAGRYKANFEPKSLSAGVYIYRITAGSFTGTGKMVYLK